MSGRGRTKIVATIGPASESPQRLRELIMAGVDVMRLNLSHGQPEEHIERLHRIRDAARDCERYVGVLADLPGPKVRAGGFGEGGAFLAEGHAIDLVPGNTNSTGERITVDYPSLVDDVEAGDRVILGDGAITLRVQDVGEVSVRAVVETGGRVQGRPGVHLPSERMRLTAPTEEDFRLIEALLPHEPDFFAVSFVRGPEDVKRAKEAIGADGPMVVSKIETAPAVADLPAILAVTDAAMVARGDLGIECPLEDVPHLQKHIIRSCVMACVPVITATQMLESMIQSPAPTRAEASDVANSVIDGTDAVMLSAETAIGVDPVNVVRTMARIAERAEAEADYGYWAGRLGRQQRLNRLDVAETITAAMTHAAWQAATDVGAVAILCCTRTGLTARAMARFRPSARLVGLSPDVRTARQLALSWGVEPLLVSEYLPTDEMVDLVVDAAAAAGLAPRGEIVAVLAGSPESTEPITDVLRLVRIG